MTISNRDPSVGKAWLAWHAIHRGDEPTECVTDFLQDAQGKLRDMLVERGSSLSVEDRTLLSDISFVLLALVAAAEAREGFAKKIVWKNRTAGKPHDKLERAKKEYAAVAIVERLIGEGFQEEQAVQQAVVDTGVSRAEIFARWRYVKAWRDPEFRERMVNSSPIPPAVEELLRPYRRGQE